MRLFLVRHGESVDNVAGLYAGSRDSALTSHGVLQARRLGSHLAEQPMVISHIFSSDLQRAVATASAVLDAAPHKKENKKTAARSDDQETGAVQVVQLPDLRERDFRSGEGVRITGGSRDAFADAETRDAMRVRVARFLERLDAVLTEDKEKEDRAVVVVSHGILLNVLLTSLLQRYAPSELARLQSSGSQSGPPKLHVAWSNTGYVEIDVTRDNDDDASVRLHVSAVNSVEHLAGLKKTRGGIGSAKFDAKQKTMDSFFTPAAKRQRREDNS